MLKIQRSKSKEAAAFVLSGRIEEQNLSELQKLLDAEAGRLGMPVHLHTGGGCGTYCWSMGGCEDALHAFLVRIRARRGHQVAAVARKLPVLAPAHQGSGRSLGASGADRRRPC